MKEYLEELRMSILKSTDDIDDIIESLTNIRGNTICVGSGGSKVVAEYAKEVLSVANSCITICLDPRDLTYADLTHFDNIFIASYSGSNFGVKRSILESKNNYLLSKRKTHINNENLLHYELENESSFVSLKATMIPMAIMLKYYLQDQFKDILDDIFNNLDINLLLNIDTEYVNIFTGVDSASCASFLESTFAESSIAVPLIHEKYSYCHGRSTINRRHDSSAIYLRNMNKDLDNSLISVLEIQMKNYVVLDSKYEDSIIDDFYLTLQCLILICNIAKVKKVDLKKIKYDKDAVRKLYYFKGSM